MRLLWTGLRWWLRFPDLGFKSGEAATVYLITHPGYGSAKIGAGRGCQCGKVSRTVSSGVVLGYPEYVHRRRYLARGQTDLGDDTPVARSLELIQT